MYRLIVLCGQKERRPHLTGGGNRPDATPAHHVDGATPMKDRNSGKESKGSGRRDVCVGMIMWFNLRLAMKIRVNQILGGNFRD